MGTLAPGPRIHGREAEVQVLSEVLDRAASGRLAVALIEGEAGIGKTRLLENGLENARARGMLVAAGRAEELERNRPFGVLAGAFECRASSADPRRAAIAALLATHGGDHGPITVTSDPGLQFRAVDAFTALAEELALSGPLVIGVDDLQWADRSSLLTLAAFSRCLAYLPVALVGCLRPVPRLTELERLAHALQAAGARQLALTPLAADAVRDLVAETVEADPGPRLLAEISGAAGNPLFITELLGALAQEKAIQTAGMTAEVRDATLPPTLRLTILRRLSFLSDDALQVLQTASVLGSGFSFTDLAAVTGRRAAGLSAALTEAIAARVLEEEGARLRFRHELIRDAIYDDLPASVRQGLHREAGQYLARAGAPVLQIAEQLARGAVTGDVEAIAWMTRAAREAAARSPDAAAELLESAIGLMDPADPGRDRLLAEQASGLMWAGRIFDAEKICRALLDRAHDPAAEGPARICLGHALLATGRAGDGLRELEQAGESPVLTGADRANGLAWASMARVWLSDLDGATSAAQQARSLAAATGGHLALSVAMGSLATVSVLRGHLQDALEIIDEAVGQADCSPDRQGHRHLVHVDRGLILLELDRLEEARASLDAGQRIAQELGVGWPVPSYHGARALERFIAGEWDDALAEAETSVRLADESGQTHSRILGCTVLSMISVHRNDLNAATKAADAVARALAETGPRARAWAVWARALVLEARGELAGALAVLAGCWDECARLGLTLEYRVLGPDLVRLALATGAAGRAHAVAAGVTEMAAHNDVPSLAGASLYCLGLTQNDPAMLSAAAKAYARGHRPLEWALACEEAGTGFARQGQAGQARPLLEQALGIYERLDAARDLARAEAALRDAGIRRGRRGPRGRPQFGWPSLTPTEKTIARLVADGLSNPQIGQRLYISSRTVQTHLAHMFAKLDINSRAQLAAQATRHPDSQSDDGPPSAGG